MTVKNDEDGCNSRTKKPYVRPLLESVKLVAEEVLAKGCKQGTGPPPTGLGCRAGGCFNLGS